MTQQRFVTLIPKTNKASNRMREAGTHIWIVISQADSVIFSEKEGPWLYIRPNDNKGDKFERWVNLHNDFDFIVKES